MRNRSKSCAVRRARAMVRMRSRAWSRSRPETRRRPRIFTRKSPVPKTTPGRLAWRVAARSAAQARRGALRARPSRVTGSCAMPTSVVTTRTVATSRRCEASCGGSWRRAGARISPPCTSILTMASMPLPWTIRARRSPTSRVAMHSARVGRPPMLRARSGITRCAASVPMRGLTACTASTATGATTRTGVSSRPTTISRATRASGRR